MFSDPTLREAQRSAYSPDRQVAMSALPPKADIAERGWHVRFVPKADIDRRIRSRRMQQDNRRTADQNKLWPGAQ